MNATSWICRPISIWLAAPLILVEAYVFPTAASLLILTCARVYPPYELFYVAGAVWPIRILFELRQQRRYSRCVSGLLWVTAECVYLFCAFWLIPIFGRLFES